jgi:hypothetical protein
MADHPQKAKSDNKSGVTNKAYLEQNGGLPPKKSVEEIEKVNTPKNAPGSVRA